MDVIWHPAVCEYNPTTSLNFVLKPFGKSFVVALVVKQLSSAVAPYDDIGPDAATGRFGLAILRAFAARAIKAGR